VDISNARLRVSDVTDDMVRRGVSAWAGSSDCTREEAVRAILEAAMNEASHEVPVTEAMVDAARAQCNPFLWSKLAYKEKLTTVYRAMEMQRRRDDHGPAVIVGS